MKIKELIFDYRCLAFICTFIGTFIGGAITSYFSNEDEYKQYYDLVTNRNEGTFVITGYDNSGKITSTVFTHKYIVDKDFNRLYCKEMNTGETFTITGSYSILDLSDTTNYLKYVNSEIPEDIAL